MWSLWIEVLNSSKKHHLLFLAKSLLKSTNCPNLPLWSSPPFILFFCEPPSLLKSLIFHWTPKTLKFFILTLSFLLKVTKFLVTFKNWTSKSWGPIKYPLFTNLVGGSIHNHQPHPLTTKRSGLHPLLTLIIFLHYKETN